MTYQRDGVRGSTPWAGGGWRYLSLGLDTLWLMGMMVCRNGHFILTPTIIQAPAEDEDENDKSDDESDS